MEKGEPLTLLRYYKGTDEYVDALEKPYIYLFGAKQWKDQAELKFDIDISDSAGLRDYLYENDRPTNGLAKRNRKT